MNNALKTSIDHLIARIAEHENATDDRSRDILFQLNRQLTTLRFIEFEAQKEERMGKS